MPYLPNKQKSRLDTPIERLHQNNFSINKIIKIKIKTWEKKIQIKSKIPM